MPRLTAGKPTASHHLYRYKTLPAPPVRLMVPHSAVHRQAIHVPGGAEIIAGVRKNTPSAVVAAAPLSRPPRAAPRFIKIKTDQVHIFSFNYFPHNLL